ncbi:MAG: UDP-glucose 4-epimerase GalE [Thermoflexales bacterium]|nr:UDP-glucose 4-epimerase GalE [Thermoflexales bacterium]
MMNVLVAGGAGYIGGIVSQLLIEAGHRVTVFDNLSKGHREAVPEAAAFVRGDLAHPEDIAAAMRQARPDAVLHFAGLTEAGESMQQPARYFRANVSNTLNLLEACVNAGVGRFVFSSTAAIFAANDALISESSPISPANCYGETKLMVEKMLKWFHAIHGLRYAALRYFNACGAVGPRGEAHDPETHLIPLTLRAALGLRPDIAIFGTDYPTPDGTCVRDYIHVADLGSAHLKALDYLDTHDTITCNLGNGAGYSVREVIDAAIEVTGKDIAIRETARRPGDAPRLVAASDLARRELGWVPRITQLPDIIGDAWTWMRAHPRGYQP